jgi:hypothetical protein
VTGRPRARWRRLLDAGNTILGGALAWGAGGLALSLLMPLVEPWAAAPVWVRWLVQLALGFGLGWWAGLVWSAAMVARLQTSEWSRVRRIGVPWSAAAVADVIASTSRLAGLTWRASVLVAIGVVTVGLAVGSRLGAR